MNSATCPCSAAATIRDCKLAYKTFGQLNAAKDNAIVYPTWYSGQHYDNEWLIGPGMALDPAKYFINHSKHARQRPVVVAEQYARALQRAALSAGDSLRQCACPAPAGHREIRHPSTSALVVGWSMGALQTFHWAHSTLT